MSGNVKPPRAPLVAPLRCDSGRAVLDTNPPSRESDVVCDGRPRPDAGRCYWKPLTPSLEVLTPPVLRFGLSALVSRVHCRETVRATPSAETPGDSIHVGVGRARVRNRS